MVFRTRDGEDVHLCWKMSTFLIALFKELILNISYPSVIALQGLLLKSVIC